MKGLLKRADCYSRRRPCWPGTVFNYSTGFATVATLAMKQVLGGSHQALYNCYQQRLFAPPGIRNGVIEPDASGTPMGGDTGVLRPVDWLRLGQLVVVIVPSSELVLLRMGVSFEKEQSRTQVFEAVADARVHTPRLKPPARTSGHRTS